MAANISYCSSMLNDKPKLKRKLELRINTRITSKY